MENKSLAPMENFRFPSAVDAVELYDPAEYDDIAPDFPRVKIPAGGQVSFEVLNPERPDDPDVTKTLEGVIVMQHTANAYWQTSETGGNPPDCSSDDGVTGYGKPGGACASCPLNEFGSGEGGSGKACKNMKNIYLLRDGEMIPLLLSLPPTSLKAFRQYANTLRFAGRGLSSVVTRVGLKRQEGNGNAYSVATFAMAGALSPELAKAGREYARQMRESLTAARAAHSTPAPEYATAARQVPAGVDPETGEIIGEQF